MLFSFVKSVEYNIPKSARQPTWLKMYAELTRNCKKQRIKSPCGNKMTWANQIKILKEQLTQLASVLGTAFINALKPLVTALNKALASIIEFAVKVVNALGKIFGWKATVSNAGIADDFSDAASGAEDVSDSMGSAAGNSKKLKDNLSKAVRSFDELKTISLQKDSSGSGGSGSGSGSGASGGGGIKNEDAFKIVETENPFESSIEDLEGLGKSIRDALMKAMGGIKWKDVYAKAKGFGKGLAQFLNGLFAADKNGNTVFGSLGKTIAGSLNSLIYSVFSFSKEFKWKDFGKALRQGIQSFINTADLAAAGYTVGNLVKGIATSVYEAVKDKKTWKNLGKKIADGINGFLKSMNEVDPETGKNGWQIAASAFSGVGSAILTAIQEALADTDWEELGEGIAEFLSGIDYGDLLVDAIKASVSLIDAAKAFADGLAEGFDVEKIITSLKNGLSKISSEDLKPIGELLSGLMPDNPIEKIFSFSDAIKEIPEVKTALEELKKIDLSGWWKNHVEPWFTLKKWIDLAKNIKNGIVSGFKNMVGNWVKLISAWWKDNVSPWFKKEKWSNIAKGIKDGISKKWNEFKNWWDNTAVVKWFDDFKNNFSAENIKSKVGSIKSAFKEKWDDFKIWWDDTAVANWISKFEKKFSLDSLKSKIGSIKAAFKAKWDAFTSWWKNIKLSFPKIKMPHFKIQFDTTNILGKDFKYPKGFNVEYYAAGGFPTQGSLFWAGERGVPEILGNVGGKTAVAGGAEITGIKEAINDTSKEEIALLRQQNQLLQALLQKDYGITKAEIGKAARDYARDQYYKTGESVFVF